ncbi:hypothetical protein GOBAR_DD06241 [Gossypium barbadense]|nr:hypothetical protein GOBAR_DD06241 [Gossypium barbadense]
MESLQQDVDILRHSNLINNHRATELRTHTNETNKRKAKPQSSQSPREETSRTTNLPRKQEKQNNNLPKKKTQGLTRSQSRPIIPKEKDEQPKLKSRTKSIEILEKTLNYGKE